MEKDNYAEDARIKEEYYKENQILANERSMRGGPLKNPSGMGREMTQAESARMRAAQTEAKGLGDCANEARPIETIQQERTRLTRRLDTAIASNEMRIRVMREMLYDLEKWQKNQYYLRDSIRQSENVTADQVMQLREILK